MSDDTAAASGLTEVISAIQTGFHISLPNIYPYTHWQNRYSLGFVNLFI